MVVGPVSRRSPVFVADAKFLREQTKRPIKYTLPGPMTMVDTLYDGHYRSREKLAREFAAILNREARELAAAGVDVIQFDEPAFNVYMDEVRDWGIAALEVGALEQPRRPQLLRLGQPRRLGQAAGDGRLQRGVHAFQRRAPRFQEAKPHPT